MQNSILIHNPNCSKSRSVKEILEERSIDFVTVDYLKDGIPEKLISLLPKLLNLPYEKMIRIQEKVYVELNLSEKLLSDNDWINILLKHPVLIERPIFIYGNKAIIGRPPERVLEIL